MKKVLYCVLVMPCMTFATLENNITTLIMQLNALKNGLEDVILVKTTENEIRASLDGLNEEMNRIENLMMQQGEILKKISAADEYTVFLAASLVEELGADYIPFKKNLKKMSRFIAEHSMIVSDELKKTVHGFIKSTRLVFEQYKKYLVKFFKENECLIKDYTKIFTIIYGSEAHRFSLKIVINEYSKNLNQIIDHDLKHIGESISFPEN